MQVLEAIRHGDKDLLAEYPGGSFDLLEVFMLGFVLIWSEWTLIPEILQSD